MNKLTFLVSGVGGDIGYSCAKILKESNFTNMVIGCDIHHQHNGRFIANHCEVIPKVTNSKYPEEICRLINNYKADALVLTSEPELRELTFTDKYKKVMIPIISANNYAMRVGFDKLSTFQVLEKNNVTIPWTINADDNLPLSYPCIFKSRNCAGGKHNFIVQNINQAKKFREIFQKFIFQEYLPNDSEEYTCAVYRTKSKQVRSIVFKRRLANSVTAYAETINNIKITKLCAQVAKILELVGSVNLQIRLHNGTPKPFEINPRFSSTVGMRDKIGFNDLIWSIEEQLMNKKPSKFTKPKRQITISKIFSEVVL
jgi:carbamoyl-phosphate synthase large subunit